MKRLRICFILAALMIGASSQSPNAQRGTMRVRKKPNTMKDTAKDVVKTSVEEKVKDQVNNNEDVQKAKDDAERVKKEAEEKLRFKQVEEDPKSQKDSLAKAAKDKLKIKKPW
jgi:hypothetical protein